MLTFCVSIDMPSGFLPCQPSSSTSNGRKRWKAWSARAAGGHSNIISVRTTTVAQGRPFIPASHGLTGDYLAQLAQKSAVRLGDGFDDAALSAKRGSVCSGGLFRGDIDHQVR